MLNCSALLGGRAIPLWRERIRNRLWVAGDDRELGACGLVWLGRALLPITQRAERNPKPGGKLLLRQTERTAYDLRARNALHALEVVRRQRLGVGIGKRRRHHLGLGHRPQRLKTFTC